MGILSIVISKDLFKRTKHVGQTFSNIVGWCWMVFDQWWILECSNESNAIKQCWVLAPGPMILITRAKMSDNVGPKVRKRSNFTQHSATPSNMFDLADQKGQTCCVHSLAWIGCNINEHDEMFPQCNK